MTPPPRTRLGLPHHDPSGRYVDQPSPAVGDRVTISIELGDERVETAWLRTVRDGEQDWVRGVRDGDHLRFELDCTQTIVNYRFHLETASGPRWLNGAGLLDWDPPDTDDFRLLTNGGGPDWVTDHVWYQIFPDRFASTGRYRNAVDEAPWARWSDWDEPIAHGPAAMTQMYGGDLDGITEHLSHLTDLGVGGIYLTPVFPARSNHRYDATTFDHVDPILGGDDALVRLSSAAERLGLRVMTDLTLNHTGVCHDWFLAAQADADSVEAGFYLFDDHPAEFETWLGVESLPKLDHTSLELRRRLYDGPESVLGRYLRPPFDMAGWRIDVANMTGRHGTTDLNHEVARIARATVDAVDPRPWLVAEHFFDASRDAAGDGWHGVMNYAGVTRPLVSWLGRFTSLEAFMPGPGQPPRDGVQMARSMDGVRASLPWEVTMSSMSLLGSHDTARWRSMATSDEVALVGFGMLMALPGTPAFFAGDEVGLTGTTSEQGRRPMPWDERHWDRTFHDWYRRLIRLRNAEPALRTGGFRWVAVEPDAVVFLRETADSRLLIRAARADAEPLHLPVAALRADEAEPLVGAERLVTDGGVLTLPGDGPQFSVWRLA
jgi:alpha-glucosidase